MSSEMSDGEEPPPPGVKLMAGVRWALLALAALLALFVWWSYASAEIGGRAHPASATAWKYRCPMHPQIVSNEPGECPICHMNLEPIAANRGASPPAPPRAAPLPEAPSTPVKRADQGERAEPLAPFAPGSTPPGTTSITLTLDRIQAIGVRTALVEETDASQKLRVTAIVQPAEQGTAEVHVRTAGFVEKMMVSQTGVAVARGEPLFLLYSPEIFQAESEFLAASGWGPSASGREATVDSARRKLELLGMSGRDIDRVVLSKQPLRAIAIYAPQSGSVIKKNIVLGSYVTPELALYEIQDLSSVYVVADVFQQDVPYLHTGMKGMFTPGLRPSAAVEARLDLIYPAQSSEAKTTRARMLVKSPTDAPFRLGEYGIVEFVTPSRKFLSVPRDAVVDTGLSTYVFVAEPEGRFSPRQVALGPEQGDREIILAGVSAGERVVSGATFLIDSESRLSASAAEAAHVAPVK